jgi:peptide/nickel transport system ATP-binding protein
LHLVEDLSFKVQKGCFVGIAGESGCGKSLTLQSALGFLPQPGGYITGSIKFAGVDLNTLTSTQWQEFRGKQIALISQDPSAALNPLLRIGAQMSEARDFSGKKPTELALSKVLAQVGLLDYARVLRAYPHELSGGMKQRILIAMALLQKPKLILADEPTTALDVTVQTQIMDLLKKLQVETGITLLFITHHLALIAQYCDYHAVMYAGKIVEVNQSKTLGGSIHPYTQALFGALPQGHAHVEDLVEIPGQVPAPQQYSGFAGCRFAARCIHALPECQAPQKWEQIDEHAGVLCSRWRDFASR